MSWEEAISIGNLNLKDSVFEELASYENISNQELNRRCSICKQQINQDWVKFSKSNPIDFYKTTRWYLYDLTLACVYFNKHKMLEKILRYCFDSNRRNIMDFGCGIGSMGIVLAKNRFNVTLADVSANVLEYAKYRFKNRNLAGEFLNLSDSTLPNEKYDVVISTDVFEHLDDPYSCLKQIYMSLKNNGILLFNITQMYDKDTHPMHITSSRGIIPNLGKIGFVRVFNEHGVHCYVKKQIPDFLRKIFVARDRIFFESKFIVKKLLPKK